MELGHRIKAVSSSSFTLSEIELLKSKTNAHAYALWMGGYNPKVHRPLPDGSSQSALRQFIQEKYILKRFQAVTVAPKPPLFHQDSFADFTNFKPTVQYTPESPPKATNLQTKNSPPKTNNDPYKAFQELNDDLFSVFGSKESQIQSSPAQSMPNLMDSFDSLAIPDKVQPNLMDSLDSLAIPDKFQPNLMDSLDSLAIPDKVQPNLMDSLDSLAIPHKVQPNLMNSFDILASQSTKPSTMDNSVVNLISEFESPLHLKADSAVGLVGSLSDIKFESAGYISNIPKTSSINLARSQSETKIETAQGWTDEYTNENHEWSIQKSPIDNESAWNSKNQEWDSKNSCEREQIRTGAKPFELTKSHHKKELCITETTSKLNQGWSSDHPERADATEGWSSGITAIQEPTFGTNDKQQSTDSTQGWTSGTSAIKERTFVTNEKQEWASEKYRQDWADKQEWADNHEWPGNNKESTNHEWPGNNKESTNYEWPGNNKESTNHEWTGNNKESTNHEWPGNSKESTNHEWTGNSKESTNQEWTGNKKEFTYTNFEDSGAIWG